MHTTLAVRLGFKIASFLGVRYEKKVLAVARKYFSIIRGFNLFGGFYEP